MAHFFLVLFNGSVVFVLHQSFALHHHRIMFPASIYVVTIRQSIPRPLGCKTWAVSSVILASYSRNVLSVWCLTLDNGRL